MLVTNVDVSLTLDQSVTKDLNLNTRRLPEKEMLFG